MAEIGAIASVIGIASTGAKLSIALFDFASSIGSAATEITAVGIEISQFCVVVKQIESTLQKARKTVRYSATALLAIEQITSQCQPIFQKIEKILADLKKDKAEPNFLGRLKWVLKRSKVQMLQKTLEASKLTLSCLLMTLLFAENVSSRSAITVETQIEDEHQKIVTQSLLVARQCAVNELESMEESMPLEHEGSEFLRSVENMVEPQSLSPRPRGMMSPNRQSRVMGGVLFPPLPMPGDTYDRRSSVLLNEVMPGDPTELRRLTWMSASSSSYIRAQPVHLLREWTEQGNRLSELVADDDQPSLQEHCFDQYTGEEHPIAGSGTTSNVEMSDNLPVDPSHDPTPGAFVDPKRRQLPYSHRRSLSEPSIARGSGDPLQNLSPSLTAVSDLKQDPVARVEPASVDIFKSLRISRDTPCYEALRLALKKYNIKAPWQAYRLHLVCDDEERCLELHEKPLMLFKKLEKEGKKPVFMVRKLNF